jgi:hypothetical protein
VHWDNFSWDKVLGEPATLDLTAEKRNGQVVLTALALKAKNADVKGTGALNKELSDIEKLTLEKCVLGNTHLSHVNYEAMNGGYKIEASGKSTDVSGWLGGDDNEENNFSLEHFPAVQFKADIGTVIMGRKRVVTGFKGVLNCNAERCNSADISGKTGGEKDFDFRILRNPKGQRQLSLHAEDAGSFLTAFDIYGGMEGGNLTLLGNYDDSGRNGLKGRFDIREFTLKDAPILAKILSLASLTGFFDTLQGKGIGFNKMSVPFVLKNDVISIKNAKASGPAIGLTAEGTITIPKMAFDLKGTVVPAYTLNSMAGKVPLFGKLLTGGEGKGIFAASYTVKGTDKDPNVTVNPLSILTPGFLRGLFDIFDKPAPAEPQEEDN